MKTTARKAAAAYQAFTIIELLTVVAIITILASISAPAIQAMIERGRSARCAGNLRQIGAALQQYVAENDYRFPLIETDPPSLENGGKSALETFGPYGVTKSVLTCPSDVAGANKAANFGSSYLFNPVAEGQPVVDVKIYGRRGIFSVSKVAGLRMCDDCEPVHASAGRLIKNTLMADGRVIQR